jgi:hypothetical protein
MTMEGLRRIALIALIIALALFVFVILGFGAYSILLIAKRFVGLVWAAQNSFRGAEVAWARAYWTCPAFVESVFDFTLPALRTEAG